MVRSLSVIYLSLRERSGMVGGQHVERDRGACPERERSKHGFALQGGIRGHGNEHFTSQLHNHERERVCLEVGQKDIERGPQQVVSLQRCCSSLLTNRQRAAPTSPQRSTTPLVHVGDYWVSAAAVRDALDFTDHRTR